LRRIRFADNEWDACHAELRSRWATAIYDGIAFDDPEVQQVGTAALGRARSQLQSDFQLDGRAELNLFLPETSGDTYRRAFSSTPDRAREAPRKFQPQRVPKKIPEVEEALILGQPVRYTQVSANPRDSLPGEPPFQDWYRSIVSVPYFDSGAGGIPVAVVQLLSSRDDLEAVFGRKYEQPARYLRDVVMKQMIELLGRLTDSAGSLS
jgi:hypothetical protein